MLLALASAAVVQPGDAGILRPMGGERQNAALQAEVESL